MLNRLLGLRHRDVLFVCSSSVDEVWIRSTALRCNARGMRVEVVICGDRTDCSDQILDSYREAGIKAERGKTLAAAGRLPCRLAVTASSGLNRNLIPTGADLFIHMPHSLASLHMIYPADAFDGYDLLFSAGPHHTAEYAAITSSRGLKDRRSEAVGYGKLDVLGRQLAARAPRSAEAPLALLAPSWGSDNLLDRCGVALVDALAASGFDVAVRPHPLFFLDESPVLAEIRALQNRNPKVWLESPFAGDGAIFDADVLIGDYSGIGFEFAALRRRPVVSVDVGLKVVNPAWQLLELQPVEISCRSQLGPTVRPDVDAIVDAARDCAAGKYEIPDAAIAGFLYGRPGDCAEQASAQLQRLLTARRA